MPHPTPADDENPEWTADDFARAKPASAPPDHIRAAFPRTREPQKAATRVAVSIRLSPEVVGHFKAGGPGWQSRIDEALRKIVGR